MEEVIIMFQKFCEVPSFKCNPRKSRPHLIIFDEHAKKHMVEHVKH